jgi:hypothetical protein
MLQMIIANRLADGAVVFLAPDHAWVGEIAAGRVIENAAEAEALLGLAREHEARCIVVDPQLIEVVDANGGLRPVAIREAIRAFGPTVRTDLAE